jgi:hypothetical protein
MMKRVLISLFVLNCFVGYSQTKKVKIKSERGVKYVYQEDSVCVERNDVIEMTRVFHDFYLAVKRDSYDGYLANLSPVTHERIPAEKLKRKYAKYRGYKLDFSGKVNLRFVKPFPRDTPEESQVYIMAIQLSHDKTIEKRVGFDPLKRYFNNFDGVDGYLGITMVKAAEGYKVTILW